MYYNKILKPKIYIYSENSKLETLILASSTFDF